MLYAYILNGNICKDFLDYTWKSFENASIFFIYNFPLSWTKIQSTKISWIFLTSKGSFLKMKQQIFSKSEVTMFLIKLFSSKIRYLLIFVYYLPFLRFPAKIDKKNNLKKWDFVLLSIRLSPQSQLLSY